MIAMSVVKHKLTRRDFLASVLSTGLCYPAFNIRAQIERPDSDRHLGPIGTVHLHPPETVSSSNGDTWVAAWADDDNLYSPSNDGAGLFVGTDPVVAITRMLPAKKQQFYEANISNIAFNRLEGTDPMKLHGTKVNSMPDYSIQDRIATWDKANGVELKVGADGRTWKSSGCICISGVLYWAIARHKYGETSGDAHRRQTAQNASIIKSVDFGRTWSRSAEENLYKPMFPGCNFATPYFIDFGRSKVAIDDSDRYVYAISNDGFWDNGDKMILGRVLRSRIGSLNGVDWEFYAGGDGLRSENWISDPAGAKPILEQCGRLGETGAVYLPSRKRYLMIGWYYPAGGGKQEGASTKTVWDFYESPKPWGSWTLIYSHTFSPQGYYCPAICPKFQSGNRLYVLTAGDFKKPARYYRLTIVPIDIT